MSFNKKTWTDRISEFITRRLLTKADGSTEQVTVSRDEGEITQEGTPLNAESFNDLEGRIESAFSDTDDAISQLNTHLTEQSTNLSNEIDDRKNADTNLLNVLNSHIKVTTLKPNPTTCSIEVPIDSFVIIAGHDDDTSQGGISVGYISWGGYNQLGNATHNSGSIKVTASARIISITTSWTYGSVRVTTIGSMYQ